MLAALALTWWWCGVMANAPWTAREILALCDGTDDGLPCEKLVDPRAYLPCKDARCHKPSEEFRSPNACGRPRPAKNQIPAPEWTEVALERLKARKARQKAKGVRNRGTHGEL